VTEWPDGGMLKMYAAMTQLDAAQSRLDALAGLMALARLNVVLSDVAADLCVIASRDGFTNKRIANALGVPSHTLRGLKDEARA
jgi:hypothetical protein